MNYLVYVFVALIAAGSVLFGLDFASAPMSPMPASPYALRAAAPPPTAPAVTAETKSAPKTEAAASAVATKPVEVPAAPAPVAAVVPPPIQVDQPPLSIAADEPGSVAAAPPRPAPRCDLDACAAAYRSFLPEDCTYQPFDGPRQLCTKGKPPVTALPAAALPGAAPEARAQACNIAACSQSYPRSFSSADCTFQPAEGPRRVCTK